MGIFGIYHETNHPFGSIQPAYDRTSWQCGTGSEGRRLLNGLGVCRADLRGGCGYPHSWMVGLFPWENHNLKRMKWMMIWGYPYFRTPPLN
jgi:hypothetical protein